MDIFGPFPASAAGNKYLLVIVDCFTKWLYPHRGVSFKELPGHDCGGSVYQSGGFEIRDFVGAARGPRKEF